MLAVAVAVYVPVLLEVNVAVEVKVLLGVPV